MKKGLRSVIIVLIIIIVVAGLGWVAYYRYKDKVDLASLPGMERFGGGKEEVDTATPVAVQKAVTGSIDDALILNGDVIPVSEVNIFTTVMGKVKDIEVKEGSIVEKDDVLAHIDRSEAGMSYAPTPVKATTRGMVKNVLVENGDYVTPQVPLFQIIDMDTVEIVVHVPERDIERVGTGLPAFIKVVAYSDKVFKGRIDYLSPVVDPLSRTREARIGIRNRGYLLKPGMFGEVRIVIRSEQDAVVIPLAAVIDRDGRKVAFTVRDGRAHLVEPELDIREGERVSVLSGIEPGDSVIVVGQFNVDEGDEVLVTEEYE